MKTASIILAAGLGKRMRSERPKVLHEIDRMPMLQYVLDSLAEIHPQKIIAVVGKFSSEIQQAVQYKGNKVIFAHQKKARGTADAVSSALPLLKGFTSTVLVVNGDTPLITGKTLKKFLMLHKKNKNLLSVLSFVPDNPASYGRIIRNKNGEVISILEEKDAKGSLKKIREVNSGVYAFEHTVFSLLSEIPLNRSKGEYYLTDIVGIAHKNGFKTEALCIGTEEEFTGINTREEFEKAKEIMKNRVIKKWMDKGVSFVDTDSVYISSRVSIGKGSVIYPNVHLEGNTRIGKECVIYPNVRIRDSVLKDNVVVKDSSVIEHSVAKERSIIGPFAHIRPESVIGESAKIGNFVEVKKSRIGSGTKASHLTYLGDSLIGKDVNIGAGTITCNYDGDMKHLTTIHDGVFIGSDTQLVAPVSVGKGAFIGAGSTITEDVPPRALALSRAKQRNIEGWAKKRKRTDKKTKRTRKHKKTRSTGKI